MSRTFVRQDTQIKNSDVYDDTVAPTVANFETNPAELETDLNNMRSMLSHLLDVQAGNWYDVINTPSALETGTQRGVSDLNDGLHAVEKKRVLRCTWGLNTITIASAGNTFDILGTGELPGNTTAAVGVVTTLGTVVADHNAAFGAHSLLEVAGVTAISPKNLLQIVDAGTRDPVLDAGDRIYGLLQSETAADGHTITDATTTRVQISFVKVNGAGTDLIAISSGAMDGVSYDYCYVERVRLEDLNEADFLGGANVDVPAGSTVTRQAGYDNQGVTPVDLVTNAILDIEGAGLAWRIRDDLEATLFDIIEGSAGGTSQFNIHAAVDEFDVDAVINNFLAGITVRSGGTRPITVGVTDGEVTTTAGDLMLRAAAEVLLDDANQGGSTWAQDGIKLSETTAEWDLFETNFGEVSLLNAISQAFSGGVRTKVQAVVTTNVAADADANGPTYAANLDTDLAPYDTVPTSFVADVEVFVNGILQRNGANAAANEDVYPGTSAANGDLRFEYNLKASPGNADVVTVIVNGQ
jgi:hypothetical protein